MKLLRMVADSVCVVICSVGVGAIRRAEGAGTLQIHGGHMGGKSAQGQTRK